MKAETSYDDLRTTTFQVLAKYLVHQSFDHKRLVKTLIHVVSLSGVFFVPRLAELLSASVAGMYNEVVTSRSFRCKLNPDSHRCAIVFDMQFAAILDACQKTTLLSRCVYHSLTFHDDFSYCKFLLISASILPLIIKVT